MSDSGHLTRQEGAGEKPSRVQQRREADGESLFTHGERLALFRNRLSEAQTQEQREEILRLLAEEEAKDGIIAVLMRKTKNARSPTDF